MQVCTTVEQSLLSSVYVKLAGFFWDGEVLGWLAKTKSISIWTGNIIAVCVCGGLDIRQEMTVESKTIKFVQRHQWLVITLHSIGKVGCV